MAVGGAIPGHAQEKNSPAEPLSRGVPDKIEEKELVSTNSGGLTHPGVGQVGGAIDDPGDAFFEQRSAEVEEQTDLEVGQPDVGLKLFL